jgi:putative Holliday junction resolvase
MQKKIQGRILAVDWGSKRIGLAVSDPTQTLSKSLESFVHTSRKTDAERIIKEANEYEAAMILLGVTYDDQKGLTPSGRSAARLADAIKMHTSIPILLWDEGGSSEAARLSLVQAGIPKKKRQRPIDSRSAAIFLQQYLDLIEASSYEDS